MSRRRMPYPNTKACRLLRKYKEHHKLRIEDLVDQMKKTGRSFSYQSVKNWCNGAKSNLTPQSKESVMAFLREMGFDEKKVTKA